VRVDNLQAFRRGISALAAGDLTAENTENAEPQNHNPEPQNQNPEPQNQNPEPRNQNPEPQNQNPEPRNQNPEPQNQNPEPQNQNAERRTPNAERGTPLVVVPTRAAGRQLMRRVACIDAVTRDELYDRLHARLDSPSRRLTALERDVMAQAAARRAASRNSELAFQLRPGLVAEMLRFYDQLRRQSQQVKRFEELIDAALGGDELDRAARRMRVQTQFLAAAFREYERLVAESSGCDEHTLRERLIAEPAREPVRHVIVTVADWIAESEGLFVADFDLLTRIPGLERLEIVATERVLASGFDERVHDWWPGLDEERGLGIGDWGLGGLRGLGHGDWGDGGLAVADTPSLRAPMLVVPSPVSDPLPTTDHPNPLSTDHRNPMSTDHRNPLSTDHPNPQSNPQSPTPRSSCSATERKNSSRWRAR
jgi:hypothetical protein